MFQIAYVFEAIDKYSQVAARIRKSTMEVDAAVRKASGGMVKFRNIGSKAFERIENRVNRSKVRLAEFQATGSKAFAKVDKATRSGERSIEKYSKKVTRASMAMRGMSAVAGNLRFRIASMLVTLAATGFGIAQATQKAMDFQDNLKEMQALTGATGKDLEFLEDTAWRLGKKFGTSGAEAMLGIKQVADELPELLKNIPGLAKMTNSVMVLATAAGMEVPDAAKALTAAIDIFSRKTEDADEIINMMAASALHGSSMIEQSTEAIIRGGGAAKAAGISLKQYLAMVQVLAKAKLKGAKAGTALNTILARMERAGIDFRKTGLTDIFLKLREELDKLPTGAARVNRQIQLFGIHHKKAGFALLEHAELLDRLQPLTEGTNEAYRQAGIRLETLRKAFNRASVTMSEKFWKMLENIEPSLVKIIDKWAQWVESITPEELRSWSQILLATVQIIDALAEGISFLLTPFRAFFWLVDKIDKGLKSMDETLSKWGVRPFWTPFSPQPGMTAKPIAATSGVSASESGITSKTTGKVKVDINIKGITEAVDSVHGTSEGNVDFNIGKNLAWIG